MFGWFRKKDVPAPRAQPRGSFFSTDVNPLQIQGNPMQGIMERIAAANNFKPVNRDGTPAPSGPTRFAMDESNGQGGLSPKAALNYNPYGGMPFAQLAWYANQTFVGYQICAILAQNWLVNRACAMPGRDAMRHGYEININEGTAENGAGTEKNEADPELIAKIKTLDKQYGIKKNAMQYIKMGRVFGIRMALFDIDTNDNTFYENPFNIDGVRPGSYRGISQIDPYWVSPELDSQAAANPANIHFYEPTWWRINGRRIHRTHLMIFRPNEVADILKPVYMYGGIPIPQLIAERVYAAERTANEAPMLALSKRTQIIKTDAAQALADEVKFNERMNLMAQMQNNYGKQILDREDEAEQFDTSLADFDDLIMTQFQLVAAASGVPATKILGTSPKGFDATGEFEADSYHEELETIQANDMEPLINRHYLLLVKSELNKDVSIEISWNPVDSPTAKEQAETNYVKSQTALNLGTIGAIDGTDERARIRADKESGYTGLEEREVEPLNQATEDDEDGQSPNED